MSSTTPAVPPRSALRDLPTPKTDSRPEVMERGSSLYTLAMGPPLSKTPSLSSGSDGDVFDDATAHAQAGTPSHSMREKERGFFGKKEVSLERDPLRIRDGREAKESSTGVYTRTSSILHFTCVWRRELTRYSTNISRRMRS